MEDPAIGAAAQHWMGSYVTTPILVPLAWLANRRTDPGTPEKGAARRASSVRGPLIAVGAVQTLVAREQLTPHLR